MSLTITKRSTLTGIVHTMTFENASPEEFKAWQDGALIQHAFPRLEAWEREFILTGITPEEWDEYIRDDDTTINPGEGDEAEEMPETDFTNVVQGKFHDKD